jgi:hypothetical protein
MSNPSPAHVPRIEVKIDPNISGGKIITCDRKITLKIPHILTSDISIDEVTIRTIEKINNSIKLSDLSLCLPIEEFSIYLGDGYYYYFNYIKFLFYYSLLFSLISLISVIPHITEYLSRSPDKQNEFYPLYLSSYSKESYDYWIIGNTLTIIGILSMIPAYRTYILHFKTNKNRYSDPYKGVYGVKSDRCPDKINYSKWGCMKGSKLHRYKKSFFILSIFIYIAILVCQGLISSFLHSILIEESNTITALTLSIFIDIVNMIFRYTCKNLTMLEGHVYFTEYRRSELIKTFIFKSLNVLVFLYLTGVHFLKTENVCPAELMSYQFFYLLVTDIFFGIFFSIIGPKIIECIGKRYANSRGSKLDNYMPQFYISDQYTDATYRMFLICLGVWVSPMLPFIGLIGYIVEYWLDKYVLMRLTWKPNRVNSSFDHVIGILFIFIIVGVMFVYPNGAIWVMMGTGNLSESCDIYQ